MYQALYRKYRPMDFDSVVGQNAIVNTLKNSIIHHSFSHAYLFIGPRGTGKTTLSKIFARNINCLEPIDGLACKKCKNCEIAFSKNCVDIIEIDAASNNGVDEIRDLKNKISLVPSELKYKVYIIDEVHMLSIGAFNALLKTLEEPPEHAIFILATTDPQKVPATIISRCQCFNFKRISNEVIKSTLSDICNKEKIKIDEKVLDSISFLSEGGLRDALGLLDKLNSYSNSNVTMDDFVEINGIVSDADLDIFLSNILEYSIDNVLTNIADFDSSGKNLVQIFIQLLNFSRNLLVDFYLGKFKLKYDKQIILNFVNLLNDKLSDIKKSSNPRIFLELLLLNFINENNSFGKDNNFVDNSQHVSKKDNLTEDNPAIEFSNTSNSTVSFNEYDAKKDIVNNVDGYKNNSNNISKSNNYLDEKKPKIINIDEIMEARINNIFALADKNLLKSEIKAFEKLKDYTFDQNIGYLVCNLLDSKVRVVSPNAILISFDLDSIVEQNLLILDKLTDVYNSLLDNDRKIAIVSDAKWDDLKNKYISNIKNKISYNIVDEPEVVFEDIEKDGIINSNAVDLFGDIVEID